MLEQGRKTSMLRTVICKSRSAQIKIFQRKLSRAVSVASFGLICPCLLAFVSRVTKTQDSLSLPDNICKVAKIKLFL